MCRFLRALGFIVFVVLVAGCSRAAAPSARSLETRGSSSIDSSSAGYSSSLGTEWGERLERSIDYVRFERADSRTPDSVATIHYDDRIGIRELTDRRVERSRPFTLQGGDIEFGLTDEEHGVFSSPYLPGIERNGRYYVRGERGDRYAIYLKNRSDYRIEVVLSVDGVDVMNGRPASYEHRGYVVAPGDTLKVEGFRDSRDSVAAFRFASPDDSYVAQKTGSTANVGVIGLAVFGERGDDWYASRPRRRRDHGYATGPRRHRANPFPGEFAEAP